MKRFLNLYFASWWLPATVYLCLLTVFVITMMSQWLALATVAHFLFWAAAVAAVGLVAASVWNLVKKRWLVGGVNVILVMGCGVATFFSYGFLVVASMFGPSEDGFADNLTIPPGIEIAEPEPGESGFARFDGSNGSDEFQGAIRKALAVAGGEETEFKAEMPSLRKAATDHSNAFRDYIEASPDWHVFIEQGNRFAARRWSYDGEPRDTLHGYISEFGGQAGFQTRSLICLDRKQWGRYSVQQVVEGPNPVRPEMSLSQNQHASRVMIDCGGVWVEIVEHSGRPERRVTKATVAALEKEFSEFVRDPEAAVAKAQARSREWASRLVGKDGKPFKLITGMQPGIYEVVYALNPGEPGLVYLKAFEHTKGTPLSVARLRMSSGTRMAWSADSSERFGAKAGFTIYEGDWGKPYAARFEVWFQPDSGGGERKLAERIFKIEGWQR